MTACLHGVVRFLHRINRDADTRPDNLLLEQFVKYRDEAAFDLLIYRHGHMVLGVCGRILANSQDVEDAFQTTFLVLLRRAQSMAWREQLGPWLHAVAVRTAKKARYLRARNGTRERQVNLLTLESSRRNGDRPAWIEGLDEDILALPSKYRFPLLLCELQGLTRHEAARQLAIPEGTLSSRLARGRVLLRQRLVRRGITLSVPGIMAEVTIRAEAGVTPALQLATLRGANVLLSGAESAAGLLSPRVYTLMERVMHTMLATKSKVAAIVLIASGSLGLVGAWLTGSAAAETDSPAIIAYLRHFRDEDKVASVVMQPGWEQKDETVAEMIWRRLGFEAESVPLTAVEKPARGLRGGMRITKLDKTVSAGKCDMRRDDILLGLDGWETLSLDGIAYVVKAADRMQKSAVDYYIIRDGAVLRLKLDLGTVGR